MSPAVDLGAFRTVRALRAGQPGVFAGLWNEHADDIWSVLLGTFGSEGEALGWMTSFRLELDGLVADFSSDEPLRPQIGMALRRHVAVGIARAGPVTGLLAGLTPEQRLDTLLVAFFELDLDTALDPESLVLSFRARAPAFGRIAAIEAGAPPRSDGPRWVLLGVLLALLLVVPLGLRLWQLWRGEVAPSESRAMVRVAVVDPVVAARVLANASVAWLVAEVPDLGDCGLSMREIAWDQAIDPMVLVSYQDARGRDWHLGHVRRSTDPFPPRQLGIRAIMEWREHTTVWSIETTAPLSEAEQLRACVATAPRWRAGVPTP